MNLFAYLEGEPTESDIERVSVLADSLRTGFLLDVPPLFVNEGEELERTVGVLLAIPPPASDPATEGRVLAEVVRVVEAVEDFTNSSDDVFAWELDGEVVGWVEAGARDQLLAQGLIGPWQRLVERS